MKVQGIFKVLIIIVACVILGALVLNTLLPNVTNQLITATEDMIFKSTGMAFDFNADGDAGSGTAGSNPQYTDGATAAPLSPGVDGFN